MGIDKHKQNQAKDRQKSPFRNDRKNAGRSLPKINIPKRNNKTKALYFLLNFIGILKRKSLCISFLAEVCGFNFPIHL